MAKGNSNKSWTKDNRTIKQNLDSKIRVSKPDIPKIKNPKDITNKGWATGKRVKLREK